jgi:hypothetical protein
MQFSPAAYKVDTHSPAPKVATAEVLQHVGASQSDGVGEGRLCIPMTDAEREEAIKAAGQAIERHMAEYAASGCFAARGAADRARRFMEQLIAGRSPEQVARMEQERGLR